MSQPAKIALCASLTGLMFLAGTSVSRPAPTKTVTLFDGRVLDGSIHLPGPSLADTPDVEKEVQARAEEPYLKNFAGTSQIQQGSPDFEVRMGLSGSFTRPGAAQKAFLYRLGLSDGVVVVDQGAVVAHYHGLVGDYAHYTYATVEDVNGDGLSDLILSRNVEDSKDIEAYLFEMTPQGPRFSGSTPVFQSNQQAGADRPNPLQSDAYVTHLRPGSPPQLRQDSYHRTGQGPWVAQVNDQPLSLENRQPPGFEPKLINLTPSATPNQGNIQSALDRLTSYTDIGSSIDYAHPSNPAQHLVAANPTLRLMELLDTRAAVYAYENATKEKTDHKTFTSYALKLQGLTSAEQIQKAYIEHTNASLGGMSPYSDLNP